MPAGVSHLYRPDPQPPIDPKGLLVCENSYFLLKVHDAQAFFAANILKQAQYLLVSSTVESSFAPGNPIQSLHKLTTFKRDTPYKLGINTNLTTWLPARTTDTIRITFKYHIKQATPIKSLIDKMEQLHLEAAVSMIRPELAVAVKVSQVAGQLLSFLLQEGSEIETFPLTMDLNLADLQAGYYAVLGSMTDETYPTMLEMNQGSLAAARGRHELSRYSYIVLQVLAIPRRGPEIIRNEPWGEMLQACKDEILRTNIRDDDDRREAFQKWLANLEQVQIMARKDRTFLGREIDCVIAETQVAIEQQLLPHTIQQAEGVGAYSDEWQQVLHFSTREDLRRAVRDYQDAVKLSERLLQQYQR